MANVAMGSTHVIGGIAGEEIREGLAVAVSASGLRNDLPTVTVAASGASNVFVAMIPPDRFSRPTPEGMYVAPEYQEFSQFGMALSDLTTSEKVYRIGPSLLENPVAASGWRLQLHKGGAYTLPSGCFIDESNIRAIGALVKVTNSGMFAYTASANAVGYVREYRDGKLTIVLDQKVG